MTRLNALLSTDIGATATEKHDVRSAAAGWISALIDGVRRNVADRRLRDQLAAMDDAMLRDIGIAADEIHLIRARNRFMPRHWADRGMVQTRWDV